MKRSEWSDKELEQLLRQMPKIKDHRDPRDIYQSLSIKANKRKRTVWIVPSVASVAAVLLITLLIPNSWLNNLQNSNTSQNSDVAVEESKSIEMDRIAPKNAVDTGKSNAGITSLMAETLETAIYEEDVIDQDVITYLVPDQNAQILVPITVIVSRENKSWVDQFLAMSDKLKEEQWGLSDFYPINATLKMIDENTMNVDVPEGHQYGTGSANEISFKMILEETFLVQGNIQKITLSTNGKPGISFGNYGNLTELNKPEAKKRSYFLYNPNNQNLPFLVPSIDLYTDIESALNSMIVENENYGLKPTLPSNFVFQVDVSSKEILVLTFNGDPELTNEPKNIYAIEAILLTAKEFGYKAVKFENTTTLQLGRFNLQNEVKVPVAPNKVFLQ